jgi:hypothetical protein
MRASRALRALAPAILLLAGCGHEAKRPTEPAPAPPSIVVAQYPGARSSGVFYDTQIWVQFAVPLDPASINERTVFLRVDVRYYPVTVTWDASALRIRLQPRTSIILRETYTVELSPEIRTPTGERLGQTYAWQFTTNSLRRPLALLPQDGSAAESPLAPLVWGATETSAGTIEYETWLGIDSTAIASHAISSVARGGRAHVLFSSRLALGTTYYWTVTARNLSTGERLDGEVRRFTTVSSGAPVDSLVVPAADWSFYRFDPNNSNNNRQFCGGTILTTGSTYNCAVHWRVRESAQSLRLAGAALRLRMDPIRNSLPTLWSTTDAWGECGVGFPGPPYAESDGLLADGIQVTGDGVLLYQTDRLAAHLQGIARADGFFGYLLRSSATQSYDTPTDADPARRPALTLYYYRVPPGPGQVPARAEGAAPTAVLQSSGSRR